MLKAFKYKMDKGYTHHSKESVSTPNSFHMLYQTYSGLVICGLGGLANL